MAAVIGGPSALTRQLPLAGGSADMSRAGPPAAASGFWRTPGCCAFQHVSLGSAARQARPHHAHVPASVTLRALPFRKHLFKRQKLADPTAHVLCFAQGRN